MEVLVSRREALIVKSLALARETCALHEARPAFALLAGRSLVAAGAALAPPSPPRARPIRPRARRSRPRSAPPATPATARAAAPANPIIQGQHPDYLVKQLAEFKAGKRDNPIMKAMAAPLSEADMKNVAAFYASKQPKPGFAKNKELVALGEKIYRGGIADRSVPACSGCHGPNGAGIPAQYPRLAGQHADYVEAQLVAFRGGARATTR